MKCGNSGFYFPLVISLLAGLVIGLLPVSPVYGDNVSGCSGGSGNSSKVIIGGRVITPSTLLRADSNCAPAETSLSLVSLTRTLTVSPGATPGNSGTKLLAAMASITPTVASPWLIRLEPGTYDLGSSYLSLKPYLNLEGAGEQLTIISSSLAAANPPVSGTVVMTTSTELRFVTVINTFNSPAVFVPDGVSNVQLFRTALSGSGGDGLFNSGNGNVNVINSAITAGVNHTGFFNTNGNVKISNSTLTGGDTGNGFRNNGNGTVSITNSTLTAGFNGNGLINNASGVVTISNSTLTGANSATGLNNVGGGVVTVTGSSLTVGTDGTGLNNPSTGAVTISGSTLTAGSNGYGLNTSSTEPVTVTGSTITGGNYGIYSVSQGAVTISGSTITVGNSGTGLYSTATVVKVGTSQFSGGVGFTPVLGAAQCAASYNGSTMVMLSSSCG